MIHKADPPTVQSCAGVLQPSAHKSQLVPDHRGLHTHVSGAVQVPWKHPAEQMGVMQSAPVYPASHIAHVGPEECALQVQTFGAVHSPLTQAGEQEAKTTLISMQTQHYERQTGHAISTLPSKTTVSLA